MGFDEPVGRVVVGYSQIIDGLHGDPQRAIRGAASALEEAATGPDSDPVFMAQFREAIQALEREQKAPSVLSSAQNAMASALQSHIAKEAATFGRLKSGTGAALEAKFDPTDWSGWVRSFFTWWKGLHKHSLPPAPSEPIKVGDARVAVLGDWGTGMYGAPICAKSIESDKGDFQIVLHLGDVYYSGTDDEERNRCLGLWPKVKGARNFSLNSNHEMYTGGQGYFDTLLADSRFSSNQKSSYFALENDHFLILCLDTAYAEHDLVDAELVWLDRMFSRAETDNTKVVLFSHHQLFSLLDAQGPKLQVKLTKYLADRQIFAWYWGHEHRCVIYDRHPSWKLHGRCVGHSGMPYFRGAVANLPSAPGLQPCWKRLDAKPFSPGGIILDGPNPYIADDPSKYGPHGYLSVEFSGDTLHECIFDADGRIQYENDLRRDREPVG